MYDRMDMLRWQKNHDDDDKARERRITIKLGLTWLAFFMIAAFIYFFGGAK
jgi:hypothetical protein